MADIAAKQFRAEQLRQQLAVLRVAQTVDNQAADEEAQSVKLDEEIALLEKQVAIEQVRKEHGGSVTEAMDAMAKAAELEGEQAAALEAAALSAVAVPPDSGTEETGAPAGTEAETPVAAATPVAGMGLFTPVAPTGGNQ